MRVDEAEARWVRQVFAWFLNGTSVNAIAKALTAAGAPKGRRTRKPGWHPQQVHRMLTNEKYAGRWRWGTTTTIRDSAGRKKQVGVALSDVVTRDRPELRVVDPDVWDRAQARLRQLTEKFGLKPGQAKRGPKVPVNPATHCPRSVLGGVLRCAACGEVMWFKGSGGRRYYACSGHASSRCGHGFQVPAAAAEAAVVDAITRLVAGWPDWVRDVLTRLIAILAAEAERLPQELAESGRRLAESRRQRDNLIKALAEGSRSSSGIVAHVEALEAEIENLERRVKAMRVPTRADLDVPTEAWVRQQIGDWAAAFADGPRVAAAVREAVERVDARPVVAPGKKRGYVELTLHYRSWELFRAAVGDRLPGALRNLMPPTLDVAAPATEVLTLGGPTPMDRWAPEIACWRADGVTWEEIVHRTGLDLNRAFVAWKRYTAAT